MKSSELPIHPRCFAGLKYWASAFATNPAHDGTGLDRESRAGGAGMESTYRTGTLDFGCWFGHDSTHRDLVMVPETDRGSRSWPYQPNLRVRP